MRLPPSSSSSPVPEPSVALSVIGAEAGSSLATVPTQPEWREVKKVSPSSVPVDPPTSAVSVGEIPPIGAAGSHELPSLQKNALQSPTASHLELEKELKTKLEHLKEVEEGFYRQRAHENWLASGDSNTSFFHRAVKVKQARKQITQIANSQGDMVTTIAGVADVLVDYYHRLLGDINPEVQPYPLADLCRLVSKKVTNASVELLCAPVTPLEIRDALFSIPNDKASGPDGFPASFFKDA
ncbi:LINE-1 retrotransposable element ORF2 protein [Linum grandiflorum]